MSSVFQNIIPPPPSTPGEYVSHDAEGGHTRWVERGGESIFWKTPDKALYSTLYVGTLWCCQMADILAA
jgi:hypothetical protein